MNCVILPVDIIIGKPNVALYFDIDIHIAVFTKVGLKTRKYLYSKRQAWIAVFYRAVVFNLGYAKIS
jgi:hypothetical protein